MRKKYINIIIEAINRSKQEVCCHLSRVSGPEVTPSEWAVLNIIHKSEKINPKALADKLGVTMSAVSQLLKTLVDKKLIKKSVSLQDKRSSHIVLTAKAKKMMNSLESSISKGMSKIFEPLSDSQLKTLAKLHQKISDSINKN